MKFNIRISTYMTSKLSRLLSQFLAAGSYGAIFFMFPPMVLAAADGRDVFESQALESRELPETAKVGTVVVGKLNAGILSASTLQISLASGERVTARLQRVARDDKKGTKSWVGTFDDAPGSVLVLSRAKGVVTGFANYKQQTLEILPTKGGKHVLYAVDDRLLPKISEPERVRESGDVSSESAYGAGSTLSTLAADGVVHDVLVVYTSTSAAKYGTAALASMIQNAVQSANQAYLNSRVGITMNLVGTAQVGFTEGSSMSATKSTLQSNTAVSNLRNQLGGDVVMLVAEHSDYCGLASVMTSNSTGFAGSAFGVVASSCLSNQSLAHEVGHVQGLMHDRESTTNSGVYPYAYGYRRCVTDGTGFRDVMSYPCSGAPRVLVFSNPYVNWNGYSAGIAYESSPSTSAENARALNNTAATVAAFRGSTVAIKTAPAAPSGLNAPNVSYDKVTLSWTDNSTTETGFKLERSPDGVVFNEIATLGTDSRSYGDAAVAAASSYYYRVRAYNSYGVSSYSNTLRATTPAGTIALPAAPLSVDAANNGNGSALVTWKDASSNESRFDVIRKRLDPKTLLWGSAVKVGSVAANTTRLIDASGNGTFRYFVRAGNTAGNSKYTGPAQVKVTGAKPQ